MWSRYLSFFVLSLRRLYMSSRNLQIYEIALRKTRRTDHVQEALTSDSVLKRSCKNATPIEMSKMISKDKRQQIVRPLKNYTIVHRSNSGGEACVSAHQLFSPRPKGFALPSSQKKNRLAMCSCANFKNVQKWQCNFKTGQQLRIF